MKLNYITIMVKDIEKSVMFYEKLVGLKVIRKMHPGDGKIVFMANGQDETMLELIHFDDTESVSVKGMVMSFTSQIPLEMLREKVEKAGYTPTDIIDQGPKPKYFRVNDPDGIVVEISIDEK
ncbi:VOC family protein [Absiella sp. AM54-8XD]|jgi:lactoylglutathione lyase|uniref:VOC family protein n=2 Tax=Amedibacillus TaxID=2749846 RepID=A0A7G9GKH2_9FIRM|nr:MULTISPECIES: VOC family protein [Bacillota]QNM11304.1 VOC family protein [[Eubacterium] hominis]MCH4284692.1 VOC family protein [Amedibacillus hominis]RGB49630.1 VOC family protein [Absiella sp. AM22-9]RGB60282.1 VOC family protein [Absiella sp. AM10-20]RGC17802.1 VOC family protein [Absiella sp. AM54-8XD]